MLGVLQGHSQTKIGAASFKEVVHFCQRGITKLAVTTNKISETKRVLQGLSSHKRLLLQLDARIAAKKQVAIQVRSTPTRHKMANTMR